MEMRIRQFSAGEAFALAFVAAVVAGVVTYFSIRARLEANEKMRTSVHAMATVTGYSVPTHKRASAHGYASWADETGAHTVAFEGDLREHPLGSKVEVVYDPKAPERGLTVQDLYNTPWFSALFSGIIWAAVAALCGYGVYARIHPTVPRTVAGLEILQGADELVIREPRGGVVPPVAMLCVTVPFLLALIYQSIVGTPDVQAIRTRPGGEQIVVASGLLLIFFYFVGIPLVFLVVFIRLRRRVWVFDRQCGQLSEFNQRWPLANLREVEVEAVRDRAGSEYAAVILHLGDLPTDAAKNTAAVELRRFARYRGRALNTCIREATDLANVVASFLKVPVRHPPPAAEGFGVVFGGRT